MGRKQKLALIPCSTAQTQSNMEIENTTTIQSESVE